MKPMQHSKRSRNFRGNGRRPGFQPRNSTFESSGPEGKIRGSAYQVIDRYQALARDALSAGDRVAAENYLQHAEHYFRVLAASGQDTRPSRFQQEQPDAAEDAAQQGQPAAHDSQGPNNRDTDGQPTG
jgi:hypothetical protein